jgi:hypothetical protein
MKQTTAGTYTCWSSKEDARLREICAGRIIRGHAAWQQIAEDFPGRSFYAVRQRWLTMRMEAAGIKRERHPRQRPPREQKRVMPGPAVPERLPLVDHKTLTAAFFGDPLPGRSALDKRPPDDTGTAKFLCDLPRRSPLDQIRAGLA